jgi:hypothetical protein
LTFDIAKLRPASVSTTDGVPQAASAVGCEDLQLISEVMGLSAVVSGRASDGYKVPTIARLAFDVTEGNPAAIHSADGVPQTEISGDPADV